MANVLVDNAKLASDVVPPITGPRIGYTQACILIRVGKISSPRHDTLTCCNLNLLEQISANTQHFKRTKNYFQNYSSFLLIERYLIFVDD